MRDQPPIVFLGPSLERARASCILQADYRPPVKRGDLDALQGPATVAIITRGRRWPWYASMILAAVGIAVAGSAYMPGGAH